MAADPITEGPQKATTMMNVRAAIAVTPSDTAVLDPGILYIGGAGNVTVRMADGHNDVLFAGCLAGTFLPVWVNMVYATGTAATNIVICRFE